MRSVVHPMIEPFAYWEAMTNAQEDSWIASMQARVGVYEGCEEELQRIHDAVEEADEAVTEAIDRYIQRWGVDPFAPVKA